MSDEDFLSRWSRRKKAVAEEEAAVETAETAAINPVPEPATPEEEDQLLAELKLPVPESMKPGDDFSAFMADGVPQFLRNRALRVLWRSNPVLANLDGLNDYDDDFRSPELTQKVLATAYQVGRGIVSRVTDEKVEFEPSTEVPAPEDIGQEAEQVAEIKTEMTTPLDTAVHHEEPSDSVKPRRMRFSQNSD